MDYRQVVALPKKFAKILKTDANMDKFSKEYKKLTVEAAQNPESTQRLD